MCENPVSLLRY